MHGDVFPECFCRTTAWPFRLCYTTIAELNSSRLNSYFGQRTDLYHPDPT